MSKLTASVLRQQLLAAIISDEYCSDTLQAYALCMNELSGTSNPLAQSAGCKEQEQKLTRCQVNVYHDTKKMHDLYRQADQEPSCQTERHAVKKCRAELSLLTDRMQQQGGGSHGTRPTVFSGVDGVGAQGGGRKCEEQHIALNLCGLKQMAAARGMSVDDAWWQ